MEKYELIFRNVCMIVGSLSLAIFFFAFGLWEVGIIGIAFFFYLSLCLIAAIVEDRTEKK